MKRTLLLIAITTLAGCQQKMATQPAPRPYEASDQFINGSSARTLEPGVVYRGQKPATDPLLTGLSEKGRTAKTGDWNGRSAYDEKSVVPPMGAPNDVANFATEFPFALAESDLVRGQQRFNVFCALCHGATGNGNGKIVERGFLRPPSYHTDPEGKLKDWSTGTSSNDQKPGDGEDTRLAQGHSRGFFRYGQKVPLKDVPVGYIFQVITWGYGGMAEHASQIPPDDRWRIIAYVRALQLSQGSVPGDVKVTVVPPKAGAAPAAGH